MTEMAQVARDAAAHIEKVGWTQETFFEGGGLSATSLSDVNLIERPCCVAGAMGVAAGTFATGLPDPDDNGLWDMVDAFLDYLGLPPGGIGDWNDDPARTKDEVVASLRSFADHVEAQVLAEHACPRCGGPTVINGPAGRVHIGGTHGKPDCPARRYPDNKE